MLIINIVLNDESKGKRIEDDWQEPDYECSRLSSTIDYRLRKEEKIFITLKFFDQREMGDTLPTKSIMDIFR